MHNSGLQAAGYIYVNSDDCWMMADRDANGDLVPNPAKFPSGLAATVTYIHSLGLKSGLYTARGDHTCAGYAGACGHEAQDARWYAAHQLDYLKDDDCSACGSDSYLDNYGRMQQGIWASGREMVLTVEGNPDVKVISKPAGGWGNAKRVGHDIRPAWVSMVSLVDMASGLWPYAHNATNATAGGWWNDLDMLEIGRGEFAGPRGLVAARAHFSLWCLMKAPLLLGNDLTSMDAATLALVSNSDAIAMNQDPLGIQGRRTAVHTPLNTSIIPRSGGSDDVAVIVHCNASAPTASQRWAFRNVSSSSPPGGGQLVTLGPGGEQWCLMGTSGEEGGYSVVACDASGKIVEQIFTPSPVCPDPPPGGGPANYTLMSGSGARALGLQYNNAEGASGPWPHSRYVGGGAPSVWTLDLSASSASITAADGLGVIDDDLVGGVSAGGTFCLEARTMGLLETWTVPLSGGKWGVVLFNRSPANDTITLDWEDLAAWGTPVPASTRFSVRDVWAGEDRGVFSGQYQAAEVPAHGVAMLVLTPTA